MRGSLPDPDLRGGLGILAGDIIRSSADLRIPLVGVTLASRHGYFHQEIDNEGRQHERPFEWDPGKLMEEAGPRVTVRINGRDVLVRAWRYVQQSVTGGRVPLYFLDTDLAGNTSADREITDQLYGDDRRVRLAQEIVLGCGGVRMLEAIGYPVRKYHMNEGHSALLGLELLHRLGMDEGEVRERCVFTTHTPIAAGHDRFAYDLVDDLIENETDRALLRKYGGEDELNMTLLALNLSAYVNGVAKRHSEVSTRMFRGYTIHAITNGVHSFTWTAPSFRQLFDRYLPGWANEPELLVRQQIIPNEYVWQAHQESKRSLMEYANRPDRLPPLRRDPDPRVRLAVHAVQAPDPSLCGPRASQEGLRLREGPGRDGPARPIQRTRWARLSWPRSTGSGRSSRARSRSPSSPTTTWTSRPGSWPAPTSG